MKSVLVIVSGPPASGKTTVSKKLAEALKLPLFSKDSLKESLFDRLGWSDREWSKKLGAAAVELLYQIAELELLAGRSLILESNFKPEFDTERLKKLIVRYGASPLQITCVADGAVLFERFAARAMDGTRHPGHDDAKNLEEFRVKLTDMMYEPLDISGETFVVDTTDFEKVDVASLVSACRKVLL
jgi:predicted kinase